MASSPPSAADDSVCSVARSRSFCSSAGPGRRVVSATLSSDGSFESDVSRYSWQGSEVLGQCVRSPRESRRWVGLPTDCKVPKQPSYRRALAMTEALMTGVREAIELERQEVLLLRDSLESASLHSAQSQGRLYETERRLRFTERYVKRLECHLVEIEQLAEQYGKQQRLREATERLAAAYSSSSGTQSQRGLSQARSGFKECTDEMCLMEAQLESKMGTLLFELKGIQGFARLCAGDVYEICVRLGGQEWRCRGTIGKDQQQRWSRPRRILRPTLGDQLVIKASEVKTLGKHLLGTKVCEIGELLSAHTQQMVIYLNTTGSLKLSLIVTWSAIETFPEDTLSRQASGSSPSLRRRTTINSPRIGLESRAANTKLSGGSSGGAISGGSSDSALVSSGSGVGSPDSVSVTSSDSQALADSTPDILRRTRSQPPEQQWQRDSCSSTGSGEVTAEPDDPTGTAYTLEKRPEMKRDWYATVERKNRARKQQQQQQQLQQQQQAEQQPVEPAALSASAAQLWRSSGSSGRLRAACAAVAARLSTSDRLPPESRLRTAVTRLSARLPGPATLGRRWSHDSDVSVESALDKFSFLQSEQEEAECKPDLLEPGMTARTSDSGISSIVHQLSEEADREPQAGDGTADSSLGLSETGSLTDLARHALDVCLEMHLTYCLKLLEGASSSGPLRLRSASCLQRLERQATLLEIMTNSPPPEEVLNDTQILSLWQDLCEGAPLYHVSAGTACERLTALLQPRLEYRDAFIASKVSRLLVRRCLDLAEFAADQQLTVFALRDYTATTTLDRIVEDLSEEVQLTDTLLSHSAESISRRLSQLLYMPPPTPCLRVVCQLLTSAGQKVTETVCSWLRDVSRTDCITGQLVPALLELLESEEAGEREGAVRALLLLAGPPLLLPPLQYLATADPDDRVRAAAELGLTEMGADGRAALQQAKRARAAGRSEGAVDVCPAP